MYRRPNRNTNSHSWLGTVFGLLILLFSLFFNKSSLFLICSSVDRVLHVNPLAAGFKSVSNL